MKALRSVPTNNFSVAILITSIICAGFTLGILVIVTQIPTSPPLQLPQSVGSCGEERRNQAYSVRLTATIDNYIRPVPCNVNNGDEALYTDKRAQYSKSLLHDSTTGLVNVANYQQLLNAVNAKNFDSVALAPNATNKLTNPLAGVAFDLIGGDSHSFAVPPAPTFDSLEQSSEYIENAWMALARDVPFDQYGLESITIGAIAELNNISGYRAHLPVNGSNLFRGLLPGTDIGPYLSQFFYQPCYYGVNHVDMKITPPTPGLDFMTNMTTWLHVQNGGTPLETETYMNTSRYLITGRDLAYWVKLDMLPEMYHLALMSMLRIGVPVNPTNPYINSLNQIGFSTFGPPFFTSMVIEVANHALHTAWNAKWFIARRLRPEAFAARVDRQKKGIYAFNVNPQASNSTVGSILNTTYGGYFLPQAYSIGSPTHPSYLAGHATVAGACVTVLKALFDNDFVIPSPLVPNANGSSLIAYVGANLTIEHELNKAAENVAYGRNHAGVHARSEAIESLLVGEQVAIAFLRDYKGTFQEQFVGWRFRGFNGNTIFI